jgi:hypothetical protein
LIRSLLVPGTHSVRTFDILALSTSGEEQHLFAAGCPNDLPSDLLKRAVLSLRAPDWESEGIPTRADRHQRGPYKRELWFSDELSVSARGRQKRSEYLSG